MATLTEAAQAAITELVAAGLPAARALDIIDRVVGAERERACWAIHDEPLPRDERNLERRSLLMAAVRRG